jgi:hypothetical protein
MALDMNDARLQYIQNLASSTLNISRDSLGPLLASEDVAAFLQHFLDGKGKYQEALAAEMACHSPACAKKCQPDSLTCGAAGSSALLICLDQQEGTDASAKAADR